MDHPLSVDDQAVFDALLRTEFRSFLPRCFRGLNPGTPFVPNWHIDAIGYQLERIRRGDINRLIINMPPRYLKSVTVSVAYPAHILGLEPWRRIFVVSYASDLALKHARDCRSVMESPWYVRAFPQMRIVRSLEDEVTTSLRGFRKATSVGGSLTGMGGDMIIIDDAQKPVDAQSKPRRDATQQWFSNTVISRLDNKEAGAIIIVTQRVHMDDLSGFLIGGSTDWEVLSLPAIAEAEEWIPIGDDEYHHRRVGEALHPGHESVETLFQLRRELGTYDFSAQYQQCPIPFGGAMIKRDWLRLDDRFPERRPKAKILQSWDVAAKDGLRNDYSVCTTWLFQDDHYYLLDVVRGRYDFPRLRQLAGQLAERHKPTVILIEDASAGISLVQELRSMGHYRVKPVKVEHDKTTRLFVQAAKFEAGRVHFPKDATFLAELLAELLAFPNGRHDDQVDSVAQALAYKFSSYTLDNL